MSEVRLIKMDVSMLTAACSATLSSLFEFYLVSCSDGTINNNNNNNGYFKCYFSGELIALS